MAEISVTCPDADVVFDVEDTEAEDHDETYLVYEMFVKTVGS